ncbi:pyridoxal kinase [Clostridia bacterium]|nr:pyridoxal kinase [Clostridia bacterium]
MSADIKKVLAIHDISSLGRASLTVVMPILSAMGVQVCPLPTAALSSITRGYGEPEIVDLTEFMRGASRHFGRAGAKFDWIYSGFLGNVAQVDIIIDIIKNNEDAKVLIDPVLGDNGKLYSTMTEDMVGKMRELIKHADIITPNWTEAKFLTNNAIENPREVCRIFGKTAIITSVPNSRGECVDMAVYDSESDEFEIIQGNYSPKEYSGAGDGFASTLLGAICEGGTLMEAANKAAKFIGIAVDASTGNINGELYLEKVLDKLKDL